MQNKWQKQASRRCEAENVDKWDGISNQYISPMADEWYPRCSNSIVLTCMKVMVKSSDCCEWYHENSWGDFISSSSLYCCVRLSAWACPHTSTRRSVRIPSFMRTSLEREQSTTTKRKNAGHSSIPSLERPVSVRQRANGLSISTWQLLGMCAPMEPCQKRLRLPYLLSDAIKIFSPVLCDRKCETVYWQLDQLKFVTGGN